MSGQPRATSTKHRDAAAHKHHQHTRVKPDREPFASFTRAELLSLAYLLARSPLPVSPTRLPGPLKELAAGICATVPPEVMRTLLRSDTRDGRKRAFLTMDQYCELQSVPPLLEIRDRSGVLVSRVHSADLCIGHLQNSTSGIGKRFYSTLMLLVHKIHEELEFAPDPRAWIAAAGGATAAFNLAFPPLQRGLRKLQLAHYREHGLGDGFALVRVSPSTARQFVLTHLLSYSAREALRAGFPPEDGFLELRRTLLEMRGCGSEGFVRLPQKHSAAADWLEVERYIKAGVAARFRVRADEKRARSSATYKIDGSDLLVSGAEGTIARNWSNSAALLKALDEFADGRQPAALIPIILDKLKSENGTPAQFRHLARNGAAACREFAWAGTPVLGRIAEEIYYDSSDGREFNDIPEIVSQSIRYVLEHRAGRGLPLQTAGRMRGCAEFGIALKEAISELCRARACEFSDGGVTNAAAGDEVYQLLPRLQRALSSAVEALTELSVADVTRAEGLAPPSIQDQFKRVIQLAAAAAKNHQGRYSLINCRETFQELYPLRARELFLIAEIFTGYGASFATRAAFLHAEGEINDPATESPRALVELLRNLRPVQERFDQARSVEGWHIGAAARLPPWAVMRMLAISRDALPHVLCAETPPALITVLEGVQSAELPKTMALAQHLRWELAAHKMPITSSYAAERAMVEGLSWRAALAIGTLICPGRASRPAYITESAAERLWSGDSGPQFSAFEQYALDRIADDPALLLSARRETVQTMTKICAAAAHPRTYYEAFTALLRRIDRLTAAHSGQPDGGSPLPVHPSPLTLGIPLISIKAL